VKLDPLTKHDIKQLRLMFTPSMRRKLRIVKLGPLYQCYANLAGNLVHKGMICDVLSPFKVYKKILHPYETDPNLAHYWQNNTRLVIPLMIPAGALIRFGHDNYHPECSNKARASVAVCEDDGIASFNGSLYTPGVITPHHHFDMRPAAECASGIHFFFTEAEAKRYHI
jgi:hypothetical protein